MRIVHRVSAHICLPLLSIMKMYVHAKVKRYIATSLYELHSVTQYLYASGDFRICRPHTELEVWLFLRKKNNNFKG